MHFHTHIRAQMCCPAKQSHFFNFGGNKNNLLDEVMYKRIVQTVYCVLESYKESYKECCDESHHLFFT